jgi:hypothetical protein
MTRATDPNAGMRATWSKARLGYPLASVVVGVARDQDGRDTTGRDEDGAAR